MTLVLYAAPSGNDGNDGLTPGSAKRTFSGMRAAYAALRGGMSAGESAELRFADGVYHFASTVFIGLSDTPPDGGIVRVVGDGNVLFTSREAVTGWVSSATPGVYYAPAPAGSDIGMVFLGNGIGQRASSGKIAPTYLISAYDEVARTITVDKATMGGIVPAPGQIMHIPMGWNMSHWRIASVVDNGATYTITPEGEERDADFAKGNPANISGQTGITNLPFAIGPYHLSPQYFWLENDIDFITAPGDWFHDVAADRLYLKAPVGVDDAAALNSYGVWRPGAADTLIATYEDHDPPARWRFENIEFGCTGWTNAESPRKLGYVGYNAGVFGIITHPPESDPVWSYGFVPPAVRLTRSLDFAFHRCRFRRIEGVALQPWFGNKRTFAEECLFEYVGSTCIYADTSSADAFDSPEANRSDGFYLAHNVIRHVSSIYSGDVASFGLVSNVWARHNLIEDCADGAFVVGSGGRFFPNWVTGALIEDNDIRNVCKLNVDTGGIYCALNMTGRQAEQEIQLLDNGPKVVARRNRLRDVRISGWNSPAGICAPLYLDLGSYGVLVEANDIEDCDFAFKLNCERFNIFINNRVTNVVQTEHITYSGYNVVDEAGSVVFYDPPIQPTGATNLAKWNGTGGFSRFRDVVPTIVDIAGLFRNPTDPEPYITGSYQSTSLRQNNGSANAPATKSGPNAEVLALYGVGE